MSFKNKIKKGFAIALAGAMLSMPVISNADVKLDNHFQEKTELLQNINLKDKLTNYKEEYKPEISIPELAINAALAYFATVYTHELGHYAVAEAYGLDNIKFDTSITNEKVASVSYEGDLSKDQKALFDSAGVLSTRLNYELMNNLIEDENIPEKLKPLASAYALLLRMDMPFRIASDSGNYFFGDDNSEYRDIGQFVNDISDKKSEKDLIYGLLIGAEALDLYLDRNEIKNNFKRALGKEVSEENKKELDLDVLYDGNKLGLEIEYKF